MEGPLGLNMFEQDRLLVHGVPLSLTFYPNHSAFYLMSPNESKGFRAIVQDAMLILCHDSVNDAVSLTVDSVLNSGKELIYPINQSIFKTFTICQNSTNTTFDSVFPGECPDSLVVALVNGSGFQILTLKIHLISSTSTAITSVLHTMEFQSQEDR